MSHYELSRWIEEYNSAPLAEESRPASHTKKIAQSADSILCSTLPRAKASSVILNIRIDKEYSVFNEADIPSLSLPYVKLKPDTWLIILRLLILTGLVKGDGSLRTSKERASRATDLLLSHATDHDHTLLVGHGAMNWLIRKELIARGWSLKNKPSNSNWGVNILQK